jgi:hypothetical protein
MTHSTSEDNYPVSTLENPKVPISEMVSNIISINGVSFTRDKIKMQVTLPTEIIVKAIAL